jgi:hypothetical protein
MIRRHKWECRYRWPETFLFKHLLQYQPFMLNGETFVRLSARRYIPASVDLTGKVHIKAAYVRRIDSINTPVNTCV